MGETPIFDALTVERAFSTKVETDLKTYTDLVEMVESAFDELE